MPEPSLTMTGETFGGASRTAVMALLRSREHDSLTPSRSDFRTMESGTNPGNAAPLPSHPRTPHVSCAARLSAVGAAGRLIRRQRVHQAGQFAGGLHRGRAIGGLNAHRRKGFPVGEVQVGPRVTGAKPD